MSRAAGDDDWLNYVFRQPQLWSRIKRYLLQHAKSDEAMAFWLEHIDTFELPKGSDKKIVWNRYPSPYYRVARWVRDVFVTDDAVCGIILSPLFDPQPCSFILRKRYTIGPRQQRHHRNKNDIGALYYQLVKPKSVVELRREWDKRMLIFRLLL